MIKQLNNRLIVSIKMHIYICFKRNGQKGKVL